LLTKLTNHFKTKGEKRKFFLCIAEVRFNGMKQGVNNFRGKIIALTTSCGGPVDQFFPEGDATDKNQPYTVVHT